MKILKSAVVAFSLAVSIGSFSTAVNAEDGRISYKPIDAINIVGQHIDAAITAINNGAEEKDVVPHIKQASDLTKEINANDKVSRETSKVVAHLKAGLASAKAANLTDTKEHLAKAKQVLDNLKKLL